MILWARDGRFGSKVGQIGLQIGQIRGFFRLDFSAFGAPIWPSLEPNLPSLPARDRVNTSAIPGHWVGEHHSSSGHPTRPEIDARRRGLCDVITWLPYSTLETLAYLLPYIAT